MAQTAEPLFYGQNRFLKAISKGLSSVVTSNILISKKFAPSLSRRFALSEHRKVKTLHSQQIIKQILCLLDAYKSSRLTASQLVERFSPGISRWESRWELGLGCAPGFHSGGQAGWAARAWTAGDSGVLRTLSGAGAIWRSARLPPLPLCTARGPATEARGSSPETSWPTEAAQAERNSRKAR